MKRLLALVAVSLLATPLAASTWHVPGDFSTAQAAIDAAAPGDTIVLHDGIHAGLVIDKPLQLMGEPAASIIGGDVGGQFVSPIGLAGPGSGTVVLSRLAIGGEINGAVYGFNPPGVSGTGFDELLVYDSVVEGPEYYWLTGLGRGSPAIEVTVPFVLVERCMAFGSRTDTDSPIPSAPDGCAGIDVTGTLVLLDSMVRGGDSGWYCYPSNTCPPGCTSSLGGAGGIGVVSTEFYHANSTISGGTGAPWYCESLPFVCDVYCCDAADGVPFSTGTEIALAGDLSGSGPMRMGAPYTLTWSTPGPVAMLYMSLGISAPWTYAGEYVFLDQSTLFNWGVMPSPGALTATIPSNLAFLGYPVAFQLLDPTSGTTRPVSGRWLP